MWTSVADFFTPTSLFLFLNLTIAAIAITSRKNKHSASPLLESDHHHYHHEHALPRAPSLLQRVRSLNFNFSPPYDSDAQTETAATDDHHHDVGLSSHPTTPTARALERASSLFKSINHFSPLRKSGGPDPETEDHHHHHLFRNDDGSPSSSHPTTPTARALERASSLLKSINHFSSPLRRSSGPDPEIHLTNDEYDESSSSSPSSSLPTTPTARALERASSIFKSLNHFSSPLSRSSGLDPEPAPEAEPRVGDNNDGGCDNDDDDLVKRSKSESKVGEAAAGGGRRMTKMTKSASEKCAAEVVEEEERRRPATVRLHKAVSIGDDHGVDSKADDFINRFKQQLKLQRLDSLLRNREMLKAQQHSKAS